jgi:hypothetical protein
MNADHRLCRRLAAITVALATLSSIPACDPPPHDPGLPLHPGLALGEIRGTLLYSGPPPDCRRDDAGFALAPIGAATLLLFADDNPPPPEGGATTPVALITVPASDLFEVADCELPATDTVIRAADFVWPAVPPGSGPCSDEDGNGTLEPCEPARYRIISIFDRDGDFHPAFSILANGSAGDIAGGALLDPTAERPRSRVIEIGHQRLRPGGDRIDGVAVTLGAVIDTEPPIFEVEASSVAMDSMATIPAIADPIAAEGALFAAAPFRIRAIADPAAPVIPTEWQAAFGALDVSYDFAAPRGGFYIRALDLDGDGRQDPHPVLGGAGVLLYAPFFAFSRARNAIEIGAGVPEVLFVGSVRPTVALGVSQGFIPKEVVRAIDVLVAPVAVMITNPAEPVACRVPLMPPGNAAELYEGDGTLWVDCQPLPTGNYDVIALQGVAGGIPGTAVEVCTMRCRAGGGTEASCAASCAATASYSSDTGGNILGGELAGQAWRIPNEYGCPDLAYSPAAVNQLDDPGADGALPACGDPGSVMLPSQSREAGYSVVASREPTIDGSSLADGHGIAECQTAPSASGPRAVTYPPAMNAELCCTGAIERLCGLPLCPLRDPSVEGYPAAVRAGSGGARATREMRIEGEDWMRAEGGTVIPLCTPFLPPVACCRRAAD